MLWRKDKEKKNALSRLEGLSATDSEDFKALVLPMIGYVTAIDEELTDKERERIRVFLTEDLQIGDKGWQSALERVAFGAKVALASLAHEAPEYSVEDLFSAGGNLLDRNPEVGFAIFYYVAAFAFIDGKSNQRSHELLAQLKYVCALSDDETNDILKAYLQPAEIEGSSNEKKAVKRSVKGV